MSGFASPWGGAAGWSEQEPDAFRKRETPRESETHNAGGRMQKILAESCFDIPTAPLRFDIRYPHVIVLLNTAEKQTKPKQMWAIQSASKCIRKKTKQNNQHFETSTLLSVLK